MEKGENKRCGARLTLKAVAGLRHTARHSSLALTFRSFSGPGDSYRRAITIEYHQSYPNYNMCLWLYMTVSKVSRAEQPFWIIFIHWLVHLSKCAHSTFTSRMSVSLEAHLVNYIETLGTHKLQLVHWWCYGAITCCIRQSRCCWWMVENDVYKWPCKVHRTRNTSVLRLRRHTVHLEWFSWNVTVQKHRRKVSRSHVIHATEC